MSEKVLFTVNLVQKDDKLVLYYRVSIDKADGTEMVDYRVDTENYNHAFLLARGYFFELKRQRPYISVACYIEQKFVSQGAVYEIDSFPHENFIMSAESFYSELVEQCGIVAHDLNITDIEALNLLVDKYKLNSDQVSHFFNLLKGRIKR